MGKENVAYVHKKLYSAVKENEMIILAEKRMELVTFMLNEISQTQKDKCGMCCSLTPRF